MKKVLGITFGGLQKRTVILALTILAATVAVFMVVSFYQNKMLTRVVGETRNEQQEAISRISEETMEQVLQSAMVQSTSLQARIADNDFAEVVNQVYMLQSMAQGLFENRDSFMPLTPGLPDPDLNGTPSAMVLCEEGVDYTASELLGIAAHLSDPMIAMFRNSDKIDGCYIGLADGTDLCVDEKSQSKLDENGDPIPFPVRERPWYTGAAEAGGLYFTGLLRDAFSGSIVVTCSAPVMADGELVGVVGIDIVLDSMDDFLNSASGGDSAAFIVNDKGQVILASEQNAVFAAEIAGEAEDLIHSENAELSRFVDLALQEPTGLRIIAFGEKQYYMVGVPMPTVGWAVVSMVDKEITELPEKQMLERYDQINAQASEQFRAGTAQTRRTVLWIIAAIVVLGSCAALLAARRIVKPIEEMTRSIVRSGRTGELFEMKDCYRTNDEIEILAEAFDDLSKKTKLYIENITEITKEKERVSTELQLASKIQNGMLPHVFPPFPNRSEFDLYAMMKPAKEVGGDFYDFFLIDEDHLGLVIADVSGKGVPAALFMMISKTILKNCAMLGSSPAETLAKTNETICGNNQAEMFVTVWMGILEISTGKLTAANAGHEYPILKRADGRFEALKDKHGFVVGGMKASRYTEYELYLEPGSKLFVYTDGVPEATDEENRMFGAQRLLDVLNREPDADPERVLRNVQDAVADFVQDAEQFDDLTMLCLEYRGNRKRAEDRDDPANANREDEP